MSVFIWKPAKGATAPRKPNIWLVEFGDGYEQRGRNGLNHDKRSWSLTFTRATTDIDSIEAFLAARGAVESFTWKPPAGAAGKWRCGEWERTYLGKQVQSITAKFTEVFGD